MNVNFQVSIVVLISAAYISEVSVTRINTAETNNAPEISASGMFEKAMSEKVFESKSVKQSHLRYEHDRYLKNKKHLKNLKKELSVIEKHKFENIARKASVGSMFYGCSNETYPPSELREIQTFIVNLDDDPDVRWKEVVQEKKNEIKGLADFFEHKYGTRVMSVVDYYVALLEKTLPEDYRRELEGIAIETGLTLGRVTLYNVFYEFFSVCTSIILEAEDGQMYHGRNLDFGLIMGWDAQNHTWFLAEILRPLIVKVDFILEGKPLYSAVTYAGYTGVLTAVKKGLFSLSVDERFTLDGGFVGIAEWLLGRRDAAWLGLLTRTVMQTARSYEAARQMLTDTQLVAPAYFILAGNVSQGGVVTRWRREADFWPLGSRHEGQRSGWHLAETNYDHWRRTPPWDQRRWAAVDCADQLGRDQPLATLYRVLSTRPVINKETTFTALMEVSSGKLQAWERTCSDPCWPF